MKKLKNFLIEANTTSTPQNDDAAKKVEEAIKGGQSCAMASKDFRKAKDIVFNAAKSNGYLVSMVLCDKMEPSDMTPIKFEGEIVVNPWANSIVHNPEQKFVLFLDLTGTNAKTLNALLPAITNNEIQIGVKCKNYIVCTLIDDEASLPKQVASALNPIVKLDK